MGATTLRRTAVALTLAALALTGCSGGTSSPPPAAPTPSPTPVPVPTPTPTASPTPGPASKIALNPSSTSFSALGYQLTFGASETSYAGAFNAASSDCSSIATFTPSQATSPNYVFTVMGGAPGTCHITITDSFNQTAVETIVVTTTSGSITAHGRKR